ncbi:MAG: DUF4142 domain-containing protein [Bacteroidia bacterium]|nr:DUF4142 domain-containing protein [Bacteroidia bacterium]
MKRTIILLAFVTFSSLAINAQTTLTERDQDFLNEAVQGSLMEVKLGELAQTNASSPAVKNLGQTMIADHTKMVTELNKLGADKKVTLSQSMGEKAQKNYARLAKKQGKDFDKAYTRCMIHDHKKDICKFKKEAKKGDDPAIKNWASGQLPALEQHKTMSEDACKMAKKS